jgi:hypothetical protein
MWHLNMAEKGQSWAMVGTFETIAAAARKIIELEAYKKNHGLFFEIYIETGPWAASEEEALGHLEHTGKSGRCYVVKRIKH